MQILVRSSGRGKRPYCRRHGCRVLEATGFLHGNHAAKRPLHASKKLTTKNNEENKGWMRRRGGRVQNTYSQKAQTPAPAPQTKQTGARWYTCSKRTVVHVNVIGGRTGKDNGYRIYTAGTQHKNRTPKQNHHGGCRCRTGKKTSCGDGFTGNLPCPSSRNGNPSNTRNTAALFDSMSSLIKSVYPLLPAYSRRGGGGEVSRRSA